MMNLIASAFAILMAIAPAAHADSGVMVSNCNNTDGNYTTNSSYQKHLASLFSKTATTNLDYGFYNLSAGHSPNKVSLISLCYGNVNVTACHACQKFVTDNLNESCPAQKTAIGWSNDCMVEYSKRPILGVLAESPAYYMVNQQKVSAEDSEKYSSAVKALLQGLPGNASVGGDRIKFASAQDEFSSSVTLYAMAQCTPDLSPKECFKCVGDASSIVQTCPACDGVKGARALLPSCIVRFEEYKFYLSSDAPVPTPSPDAGPSMSPSLAPDMTVSPSPSREPDSSPSLAPDMTSSPSPSPSREPNSTPSPPSTAPNPDDSVNTKVGSPSPSSIVNAATMDNIGRASLIWAIVVFIECLF